MRETPGKSRSFDPTKRWQAVGKSAITPLVTNPPLPVAGRRSPDPGGSGNLRMRFWVERSPSRPHA